MVVLVSDDDAVAAVAADAGRAIELPVLLPADAELVVEGALRSEDLDAIVGAVGDQDEALLGAANAPRPAKLTVFLALGSEREDGDPDVVVVAAGANLEPREPQTIMSPMHMTFWMPFFQIKWKPLKFLVSKV